MKRADVFELVNAERDRQDAKWSDRSQYSRYAAHLLVLEEKVSRLRGVWYASNREALREEFIKVAALAVRALEEVEA